MHPGALRGVNEGPGLVVDPNDGALKPWNVAWGLVRVSSNPVTVSGSGTGAATLCSGRVTIDTVAGRRYRTSLYTDIVTTVGGDTGIYMLYRDGVQITWDQAYLILNNTFGYNEARTVEQFFTGDGLTHYWDAYVGRFTGTGTITLAGTMAVEDVGPA